MTLRKKAFLMIKGMHCGSCAVSINMLLTNKKGVFRADVDFDAKRAEIEYDPEQVKISELVRAIEEIGYHATEQTEKGE